MSDNLKCTLTPWPGAGLTLNYVDQPGNCAALSHGAYYFQAGRPCSASPPIFAAACTGTPRARAALNFTSTHKA